MVSSATITLHNPYLDLSDSQCVSANRCLNSARYILAAYHKLSGTSLDISRMHPFVVVRDVVFKVVIGEPDASVGDRYVGILQLWLKSSYASILSRLAIRTENTRCGARSIYSGTLIFAVPSTVLIKI